MARIDLKSAGIAIGIAALALGAGASGAKAQQPDNSGVFMKDILGSLGIIEGDSPRIDYRERPNLVLPPGGAALPAPRAGGPAAATGHPNWPNDPDVAARQRAIEAANAPVPVNRDRESDRLLTRDELRAGTLPGGGGRAQPSADACFGDSCGGRPLNPRELRNNAPRRSQQPVIAHGQEPTRGNLTQPPTGYRMPSDAPIPEPKVEPIERIDPSSPYFFLNSQRNR